LLFVIFGELAGLATELEDRDLASRARADSHGHYRCAESRADVHGAIVTPTSIKPVNVFVSDDATDRELVHARERELSCVCVTRKNERDVMLPKRVGFFCDVRKTERRNFRVTAFQRAAAICVRRVGVVEPDDLKRLMPHVNHGILISQDERARTQESAFHFVSVGPVVVVAEHAHTRCFDRRNDVLELAEKFQTVANEVARDDDEVWLRAIRHGHRFFVDAHWRDAPHVKIREMRDANRIHRVDV
jgi:hypothetical protein